MLPEEQIVTKEGNVVVWGYRPERFYNDFEKNLNLGYLLKKSLRYVKGFIDRTRCS